MTESPPTSINLERAAHKKLHTLRTELREKYLDRVLHLYRREHLLLSEIAQIIPVSPDTIASWIAIFGGLKPVPRREQIDMTSKKSIPRLSAEAEDSKDRQIRALLKEIKELKKESKKDRIRADLYQEMIRIAEDRFNIEIVKKPGAKQS